VTRERGGDGRVRALLGEFETGASQSSAALGADLAQRAALGRRVRKEIPRSAHAECVSAAARADPLELLRAQEATRVRELVALRHERMLASPFAFYRGAAAIMAADLAALPSSGLRVQLCGDAHLSNFGGFAAPDRAMVFDINDFDETSTGPFEWDVKRLTTSFEIAARSRDFPAKARRTIVLQAVRSYRQAMGEFAAMPYLDVWYSRVDADAARARWGGQLDSQGSDHLERSVAKARSKDSVHAVHELAEVVDGEYRIASDPPVLVPLAELLPAVEAERVQAWLRDGIRSYTRSLPDDRRHLLEQYRFVDFARKVVGVGSVGTRCWIALLFGRDERDPLVLQIKEAERSVLEEHCGPSGYANHGQRVVEGQRLIQASSDLLLGWLRSEDFDGVARDFYVRQLWDWKLSPDVDRMPIPALMLYAELCGWTLAHAHARSGDPIAISAYLGTGDVFDQAMVQFSSSYADQNERDYDAARAVL